MRKTKTPSPGMVLTDGKNFYSEVSLAQWDEEENYKEISIEEYKKIMEEREQQEL